MPKRDTFHMRSINGKRTKVYAVRDSKGRFKNIVSYRRSSRQDQRRTHTRSDR